MVAFLATAAAQTPTITAVVNGASLQPGITPGCWVTITGNNLANITGSWQSGDFRGDALPTTLNGVSVTINGQAAAIYYTSSRQLNVLAPNGIGTGSVPVSVNVDGRTANGRAEARAASPALFLRADPTIPATATQFAAAFLPDGRLIDRGRLPYAQFGYPTRPLIPGERFIVYGTGFGLTNPPVDPMRIQSAPAPLSPVALIRFELGGQPVVTEWAGLISNGIYQFNLVAPAVQVSGVSRTATPDLIARAWGTVTPNVLIPVQEPTPAITGGSGFDLIWGQQVEYTMEGANLGDTILQFEGAGLVAQRRPVGFEAIYWSTNDTTQRIFVDPAAGSGTRMVRAIYGGGLFTATSNAFPIRVRPGSPAITQFEPRVLYRDRVSWAAAPVDLSQINPNTRLLYANRDRGNSIRITGTDLGGIRLASIPGIDLIPTSPRREGFSGAILVGPSAPPGMQRLELLDPGGNGAGVEVTIADAPPGAPRIAEVTLTQRVEADPGVGTAGSILYQGRFRFEDADGDIGESPSPAFLRMQVLEPEVLGPFRQPTVPRDLVHEAPASGLRRPGETSGVIEFAFRRRSLEFMRIPRPVRVALTLVDSAGLPSNSVIVTAPSWVVHWNSIP